MKKIVSVMLLIIMIFTISSCSSKKEASSTKLQTLNIGILQDTDSIPVLIAKEQGYFKDENLDVNIEQFKSAQERDSALQSGKIDGAISDIMAAAFANDGEFNVKITSLTNGTYDLLVN
ncbi:ABC transporter substrate-binding protein [Thermoanaerobacterium thermosaccharolyticum]|uniref:ABC transporter substrate-binding protein n=1 Tax=Thermoanaerobacterium thermosaccharolyticum TaxID=1517 RepID=UPI003DA9BBA1